MLAVDLTRGLVTAVLAVVVVLSRVTIQGIRGTRTSKMRKLSHELKFKPCVPDTA
jgi:hypothetical protein